MLKEVCYVFVDCFALRFRHPLYGVVYARSIGRLFLVYLPSGLAHQVLRNLSQNELSECVGFLFHFAFNRQTQSELSQLKRCKRQTQLHVEEACDF